MMLVAKLCTTSLKAVLQLLINTC